MASLYLGTGRLEQELVRNVPYITGFGKVRTAPPEDWLCNARAYGNRASDDMWWLVQNKPQSGLTLGCFRGIFLDQVRSGGFQNKGTNRQTSLITVKSLWISWDFSQTLEPHRIMLSQWGTVSTSCDLYLQAHDRLWLDQSLFCGLDQQSAIFQTYAVSETHKVRLKTVRGEENRILLVTSSSPGFQCALSTFCAVVAKLVVLFFSNLDV